MYTGGIVCDYPNSTKAKKHYLVLTFERNFKAPQGLTDGALLSKDSVRVDRQSNKNARKAKANASMHVISLFPPSQMSQYFPIR